tara:strand:+ start:1356 stop:2429 length:1074 start_codon:yes stop_codon:yes gene_type:complete
MSQRQHDINGWFEVKDNPISKVGVFPYLGSTIDSGGEFGLTPDKLYNVFRPELELNNPETIDSFKLVPWIDDHEFLGDTGTPAEEKGVHGVVGEDIKFVDGTLTGNIKVFSERLKTEIETGKQELSLGYRCKYEKKSGSFGGDKYDFVQADIRGNHLALVDQGRMGSDVKVQDHFILTVDSGDFVMSDTPKKEETQDEEMTLAQVMEKLDALAEVVAGMQPSEDKEESTEDMTEESEDETEKEDKATGDMKTAMDAMEAKIVDLQANGEKLFIQRAAQRSSLVEGLSAHIGTFDHSEMTLDDVAKYGADKLGLDCAEGQAIAGVKGYLKASQKTPVSVTQDSAPDSDSLNAYFKGAK